MKQIINKLACLALALGSTSAMAQTFTVGEATTTPGGNVVIPVNFTSGATAVGAFDLDVFFDNTKITAASGNCGVANLGQNSSNCSGNAGAGQLRISIVGNFNVPLATGLAANLSFTIDGGASPGDITLDGSLFSLAAPNSDDLNTNLASVVDGKITIQGPNFTSNPVAGGGNEFVFGPEQQGTPVANQTLTITNTGIGTLSGTCSETVDAGNVFTITNGVYSAGAGLNDTVTVACNTTSGAIATHTGQFECTHNGGNVSSPVTYDMSCQITAGPEPAYSSSNPAANQAINLAVSEAGDPNPSQTVTISNSGQNGSTLTGTCSMLAGDSQITLTTAGGFTLGQGATSNKTVSCDATVQGNYSRTLQCTHNGTNIASPVNYAVSCVVPEAGSAVFDSNPVPGPIDVDNGGDVVVDDTDPTRLLTFFNNADAGDQYMDLNCSLSGDAAITVQPDISGGISIAPDGGTSSVTFSCDTENAGNFTATYSCNYSNGGVEGPVGNGNQPEYQLSCEVREPEAQVEITPAPNTPQNKSVPPGGSTSFTFDFEEINDEGLDGNLVSCSLGGGQGFTIGSPSFPQNITSGSTVPVVVNFTDPTGADSWSDTLTCMFGDSDDDDTEVSWPLTVNIGGDARITVLKDFTDGNPGDVTVVLDCNTGLILDQDKDISEDGIGVTFVITDYTAGILDCYVRELPVAGYSADYEASGDSDSSEIDDPNEDAGCYFTDMAGGVENLCQITNSPDPVDVVITKEWLYPGSANASMVSDEFEVLLLCANAEIEYADKYCGGGISTSKVEAALGVAYSIDSCKWLEGNGNTTFTESVTPYEWPGGMCWAVEVDVDQAVEVDNGCASGLEISAGSGASCTITNTVFFEGIPTLSQYGMLLMALLMMGVGFVAVRRIS